LQNSVVCGEGRDRVGLLGFPNIAACRMVAGNEHVELSNE
jgi:feruloyl-CoA synthase